MDVQVEHRGAEPVNPDGDGEIVEDAETRALLVEGMMCAAGEIAAEPGRERVGGGGERSADRCQRPADQPLRPWEADAPHHLRGNGPVENAGHVRRVVRELDGRAIRKRGRLTTIETVRLDRSPEERIFLRGETVSRGQRDRMVVAIEQTGRQAPISLRIASAMVSHDRSTWAISGPSTITRASGSVPENRTSTRPDPANSASTRSISRVTEGASVSGFF